MTVDSSVTHSVQPAPSGSVTAAPTKAPFSPERLLSRLARLDRVLLVLVVVLAFLLASFRASNSELLQHFAVGRLIAHGNYQFGVDPFTFTTEGVYWANHSWLFGLIAYGIYSIPAFGGALLVIVKALLVALLAIVMLRSSWRPGERWWLTATIVGLAVLALSPRLYLQPVVVSYLFLGLTLWCLIRVAPQKLGIRQGDERKKKGRSAGQSIALKAYWPLPVLCVLWVNLDQWFFLGPLTVGLYLAGVVLQDKLSPLVHEADEPTERPKTLGIILLACVGACLISPHHVHAFILPPQLGFSPAADAVRHDRLFGGMFLSPLSTEANNGFSYFQEYTGLSIAGMAYFPLLLLGLISFVLTFGSWRLWRILVWAFFAGLSLYHARAIPFFAVVAAPITALNFLDYAGRRFSATYVEGVQARSWALSGRVLTLFFAILLVEAAVPGWTQATPHAYRHVGWQVSWDPSLEQAALQIAAWQKEGKLPADIHWLNATPEVVNYFAWFCPGVKGFFDHRLTPFDSIAADIATLRKSLVPPEDAAQARSGAEALTEVCDKYHIEFVAGFESDILGGSALNRFLLDPEQWPRIYSQGKTVLFHRTITAPHLRFDFYRGLVVNDSQWAFGPDAVRAPTRRPEREPRAHEWYEELWLAPPPVFNTDADDGWLNFRIFLAAGPRMQRDHYLRLEFALASSVMGLTASGGFHPLEAAFIGEMFGPIGKLDERRTMMQQLAINLHERFVLTPGMNDNGPPASLYLALRSARRALHTNPDDAQTHLLLGKLYLALKNGTREGMLSPTDMREVRLGQICGALHQALRLNPDLKEAHELLAGEYQKLGLIDLYAKQMREALRCAQESGLPRQKNAGDAEKRLQQREEQVKALEDEVQRRQNHFISRVGMEPTLKNAVMALTTSGQEPYGLAETALDILKKIDLDKLGKENIDSMRNAVLMQINLLFLTGQLQEIREVIVKPADELYLGFHPQLRVPVVEWCRIRLAAASGDYAEADALLAKVRELATVNSNGAAVAERVGYLLSRQAPRATLMAGPFPDLTDLWIDLFFRFRFGSGRWQDRFGQATDLILAEMAHQADLSVLRGWLALEAGDNELALTQLRAAVLQGWPPQRSLPLLVTLGADSPVSVLASLYGSGSMTLGRLFDFNGHGLATMGLQWLQEQKK